MRKLASLNTGYTHVVWFVPPQLISGTDEPFARTGCWCIESWAHHDFGQPDPDMPSTGDLPADADPRVLAAWVAEELGYPVALEADPGFWIKRTVFIGARPVTVPPKVRTPLYIVRPAA
jgi:hypothetical protein